MLNLIEKIHSPVVFDHISPAEWDTLAQASFTNTPFQTHAYQKAWWTHLGTGELITIVVRNPADQLIGLAPFYLKDDVLYFNGSKEETDYLDIISTAENAEFVWQTVFDCLCSSDFPAWSRIDLHCVPASSPTRHILPRLVANRGFSLSETVEEVCPIIPLTGSFEDYLMSIDKKQRHEIRRKMRKAESHGAELEIIRPGDDLPQAVEDFLGLLQLSMQEKSDWLTPGRRALFHDVAQAALAAGTLQLMFMRVENRRWSALFNFAYHGRTWVYNSGIDMTGFQDLSLGIVLSSHAIEQAAEQGFQQFDFLRGNEAYKYRFGAQDSQIYRLEIEKI